MPDGVLPEHPRSRSVPGFIAEDFSVYQDGKRVGHARAVAQMHSALPSLRAFEPRFDDVAVIVLCPNAAFACMTLHDVVTDAQGVTSRM